MHVICTEWSQIYLDFQPNETKRKHDRGRKETDTQLKHLQMMSVCWSLQNKSVYHNLSQIVILIVVVMFCVSLKLFDFTEIQYKLTVCDDDGVFLCFRFVSEFTDLHKFSVLSLAPRILKIIPVISGQCMFVCVCVRVCVCLCVWLFACVCLCVWVWETITH